MSDDTNSKYSSGDGTSLRGILIGLAVVVLIIAAVAFAGSSSIDAPDAAPATSAPVVPTE